MEYRQFGNTYMARLDPGEEVLESLKTLCAEAGIRLGRVEAIGATDHAVLGVYDLNKKQYYPEEINEFMEITTLTGNITALDGKPYVHLHATLADQRHAIHGGHVLELRIGATCEIFIDALDGDVTRQRVEALGINRWAF